MAEKELMCGCDDTRNYMDCCGRYHNGKASAPTALELMRSRYAAYVHGEIDYLVETMFPGGNTAELKRNYLSTADSIHWLDLEIVGVSQGGESDKIGEVEFKAVYVRRGMPGTGGGPDVHHERSKFRRKGGKWYYVDGVMDPPDAE